MELLELLAPVAHENGILTCPWHGWTFHLGTGNCEEDDSLNLQRYETIVDGDDILVRL